MLKFEPLEMVFKRYSYNCLTEKNVSISDAGVLEMLFFKRLKPHFYNLDYFSFEYGLALFTTLE